MKLDTFKLLIYVFCKKESSLTQIEKHRNINYLDDEGIIYLQLEGFIKSNRSDGEEIYFITSEKGSGFVYKIAASIIATTVGIGNLLKLFL